MPGPSKDRVTFDEDTRAVLAAFADTLIPPDGGFPAPSAIRVVEDFMTRYVAADDAATVYPPGVTLADVQALVEALGAGFDSAEESGRVSAVAELESGAEELFKRLQELVYAGYYSRPEVRTAIAGNLEAGRDFRGSPQPYGYADVIEPWDESKLNRTGSYTKTEDVKPLDREALERLVASWTAKSDEESGGAE